MVTAILAALIVSLTAAVVLNMTFRRFELSAFRTDHTVAGMEAEAGLQYAFARLTDPAFQAAVQLKRTALGAGAIGVNDARAEYIVSCLADVDPNTAGTQAPDEQITAIHMGGTRVGAADGTGGKHVTVRIRFFTAADAAPIAARPYRVRASTTFGTGGA